MSRPEVERAVCRRAERSGGEPPGANGTSGAFNLVGLISMDQPWKVELCARLRHPRAMAVEAAKRAHTSLAVRAEHAPEKAARLQALLRLIGALVLKRSAGQHEVAALAARGMTGRQIAAELEVSEQAISKRRLASFFEEEAEALPLAIALIEALDPVPTGAAS